MILLCLLGEFYFYTYMYQLISLLEPFCIYKEPILLCSLDEV